MKINSFHIAFICLFLVSCSSTQLTNEEAPEVVGVIGQTAGLATAHPVASEVGLTILKEGGNAYDAAIAVQFALAVVYPRAGNIGGGGVLVFRLSSGELGSLDFREKAPGMAHRDMYLDPQGDVIEGLSKAGALASGVPGSVGGMFALHEKLGSKPWSDLLAPAIALARSGVVLTTMEADVMNRYKGEIEAQNSYSPAFIHHVAWETGDTLKQPELASTLESIQRSGRDGFYKGDVAAKIVAEMQKQGGLISLEDLENYNAVWREPLIGHYKGHKIISMPPPSSGGVALVQLFEGSKAYPLDEYGHNAAKTIHIMTELERRVYADRATYLGDPDFFDVPLQKLLNPAYLKERFSSIDLSRNTPSKEIKEGKVDIIESIETTHFSIVDAFGNTVSLTTTLNGNFGSKVVVEGAGFFLNNEMDDFSVKQGIPNMFGLIGYEANEIAPGKRMLSSMTPTIVEKEGRLFMVIGTPGGSTIITSVYQTILNVIDHDMTLQGAINAKKLHHQWLPDKILVEEGAIDEGTEDILIQMGHQLDNVRSIGRLEGILIRADGSLEAAADHTRGDDTALAY